MVRLPCEVLLLGREGGVAAHVAEGGQLAVEDELHHLVGQAQQADALVEPCFRLAHCAGGGGLVSVVEVEHGAQAVGFFDGVEVGSLHVLGEDCREEADAGFGEVVPQHHVEVVEADLYCGAPAAFAGSHDVSAVVGQLVGVLRVQLQVGGSGDRDAGLKLPGSHVLPEFGKLGFVEGPLRVQRGGGDGSRGDVNEIGAGCARNAFNRVPGQRGQGYALSCHGQPP